MTEPSSLAVATVQEIQLELIRRTRFNDFIGEQVYRSLLLHRELWTAAILDRAGHFFDDTRPGDLPAMSLIKLRDLASNLWNVDTLFVLTPGRSAAEQLVAVAEEELWMADEIRIQDEPDADLALGGSFSGQLLLTLWWD